MAFLFSQTFVDQFRQVMARQRQGANDAAMPQKASSNTTGLSRVASAVLGGIVRHLRPSMAADAGNVSFERALRGVTRQNFRQARPFIERDIRKMCAGRMINQSALDRLPDLLKAYEESPEVMGLDGQQCDHPNGGMAFRQANADAIRGSGSDTQEHVGGDPPGQSSNERGTSGPPTVGEASMSVPGMAAEDQVDEEGMSPKSECSPTTRTNLSGEVRVRTVRETGENHTDVDVNRIVADAVKDCMRTWNHDQMLALQGTRPAQDAPPYFEGIPKVGKGPACDAAPTVSKTAGSHIGEVSISYSPDQHLRAADYGLNARRQYVTDLTKARDEGLDQSKALAAAAVLAEDRANKRSAGPSPVFLASGAQKIGIL
jgi:hypothetical protein